MPRARSNVPRLKRKKQIMKAARGAYHSHILTKKDPKRKRRLRRATIVQTRGEAKTHKRLLQA